MEKLRSVVLNARVIILLICIVLAYVAINPQPWHEGVAIKAIARNSSAEAAGIVPPNAKIVPTARERILAVDNQPVRSVAQYYELTSSLAPNSTVQLKTNKQIYTLFVRPKLQTTTLNESQIVVANETREVNETVNGTTMLVNKTFEVEQRIPVTVTKVVGVEPLGITVDVAATSNLRKGLDLQGGTRVLLKPKEAVSAEQLTLTVDSLTERLNVYGLSDVVVREVSDSPEFLGGGESYVLVEMAGVSEEEVRELVASQGKFEAKIANKTVFGGADVTYVCRTPQCSGIDLSPGGGCRGTTGSYSCPFYFTITLSPEAARRQADATRVLDVLSEGGDRVLSEKLFLYLDDSEVSQLSINADLKGSTTTSISIHGGGAGTTEQAAMDDALKEMKRLQTVLITGSLPVKLEVVRIDTVSPTLGQEFLRNALFIGVLALIAVMGVLVIVYRKIIIAFPIMFTALSEIFLTVGLAALIGWNIDLAAVAGIILAVGTGVNDQIVITDEALRKQSERVYGWKERIKRAFFIIFSAYLTTMVAMVPLLFAGAGLLKGFAITTMLAVTIGVFITRPAYAAVVQRLLE